MWVGKTDPTFVVADNTNADPDVRAQWIRLARTHNVPIRCVLLTSPAKLCAHNDAVRALGGTCVSLVLPTFTSDDHIVPSCITHPDFLTLYKMNPEGRTKLPAVAFSSFVARFRDPTDDEGFDAVIRLDFVVRSCRPCVTVTGGRADV